MSDAREWRDAPTSSERAKTLFTATRMDEEPWRISRLKDVYETAQQICMVVHQQPFPNDAVARMHDHKGELTIQFADDEWELWPSSMFELGWESVNECVFTTCTVAEPDGALLMFTQTEGSA